LKNFKDNFPAIPLCNTKTVGYGDNPFDLTSSIATKQKKKLNHRQKAVYYDINTYNGITLDSKQQSIKPIFGNLQKKESRPVSPTTSNLITCTMNFENNSIL
jgi:hypothetical protein